MLLRSSRSGGGGDRAADDHDEVELLLESFASDLQNLALDVSKMRASLEDTDDFVNIHLSTKRNEIIRLSYQYEADEMGLQTGRANNSIVLSWLFVKKIINLL